MYEPVISIVIPLYNKEKYVKRALDSVLAQTFKDFEVIVVNDGSTDKGSDTVRQFDDSRIRLITQENGGVSAARNRGIQESKAELIAFLDADDTWLSDFLATIMDLKEKYPHAGAYATGYRIIKGGGVYRDKVAKGLSGLLSPGRFTIVKFIHTSSIVVYRKVFDDVGNFRVGYKMTEDVDMWFRIVAFYLVAYNPKVCSQWDFTVGDSACHTNMPDEVSPLVESLKDITDSKQLDDCVRYNAEMFCGKKLLDNLIKLSRSGQKKKAWVYVKLITELTDSFTLSIKARFIALCPAIILQFCNSLKIKIARFVLKVINKF